MPRVSGIALGSDRPPEPADVSSRQYGPIAGRSPGRFELPAEIIKPTRILLPPNFYPPAYGAQSFFPFGLIALMAGPSVQVVPGTVQILEPGFVGVVRSVALALRNMLATTDARLQLLVGDVPMAPIRRLPAQPVAYIEREWDSYAYLIPPGGKTSLRAQIVDAGAYPITAYYEGWALSVEDWAAAVGAR